MHNNDTDIWQSFRQSLKGKFFKRGQAEKFAKKVGINKAALTRYFGYTSPFSPSFSKTIKVLDASEKSVQETAVEWICQRYGFTVQKSFEFTDAELEKNGMRIFREYNQSLKESGDMVDVMQEGLERSEFLDKKAKLQVAREAKEAGTAFNRCAAWILAQINFSEKKNENSR